MEEEEIKTGAEEQEVIQKIQRKSKSMNYDRELYVSITTNKRKILLEMSATKYCCEWFGCGIVIPPDVAKWEMEGEAIVQDVCIGTDWSWNDPEVDSDVTEARDTECGSVTVNVRTSMGLLKMYAYNIHNGYYAHSYRASWDDYENRGSL